MPTYQYRCKQCREEFEKVQSFSDDSTPPCPGCGTRSKKNVSKIFGNVAIAFRGSGFYKNDSVSAKTKASASGSSDSTSTKSSSGDSTSADSKSTSSSSDGSSSSNGAKSSTDSSAKVSTKSD